jgi:hypothetical protein
MTKSTFVHDDGATTMTPSIALFVWTYQQNQQPSSSIFLSQQTSEQCFQHNKPAKRTGRMPSNKTMP